MVLTFKKIQSGANKFFKKVDNGASNVFQKTVPDIANKASNTLQTVGGQIESGATKVGNFLEKNAGVISDVTAAGLYTTGFGAPLATAVLAAGNTAQQVGARMKQGGQQEQQGLNTLSQLTQSGATNLSNKGQLLQGQIKTQASQLKSQANNALAQIPVVV